MLTAIVSAGCTSMRKLGPVLAAILGAAQLAAAGSQGENMQAARIARDAFYRCAAMTVPEYDDGISPANIVAKAIAVKCESWASAMVKYTTRTEALELYKQVMSGEEGNLLAVVLRHRVMKARPPAQTAAGANRAPPGQPVRAVQRGGAQKAIAPYVPAVAGKPCRPLFVSFASHLITFGIITPFGVRFLPTHK